MLAKTTTTPTATLWKTPLFMSSANGTLIDGMTSAGTNTIASLRLMLTLPNKKSWEPHYDLSLLDLVKSAGVKTYWISNQGFLGEYDTPISSLASKADETIFLKNGGSFNSTNYSDFDLLPKFAQVLEANTAKHRNRKNLFEIDPCGKPARRSNTAT